MWVAWIPSVASAMTCPQMNDLYDHGVDVDVIATTAAVPEARVEDCLRRSFGPSCDEVRNMHDLNIPMPIIEQTWLLTRKQIRECVDEGVEPVLLGITCDEVRNMHGLNIPTKKIVEVSGWSPEHVTVCVEAEAKTVRPRPLAPQAPDRRYRQLPDWVREQQPELRPVPIGDVSESSSEWSGGWPLDLQQDGFEGHARAAIESCPYDARYEDVLCDEPPCYLAFSAPAQDATGARSDWDVLYGFLDQCDGWSTRYGSVGDRFTRCSRRAICDDGSSRWLILLTSERVWEPLAADEDAEMERLKRRQQERCSAFMKDYGC